MGVAQDIRQLWERSPRTVLGGVGLALALVVFLFQLPFFLRAGFSTLAEGLAQHVYVLVFLLLLTARTRTVSLRTLVVFWLIGVFPATAVAILAGNLMAMMFELNSHIVHDLWVPATEELIKVLPVVLYFWVLARRDLWQPAISDGLLLAFAVGAGFSFHEDMMQSIVSGGGWGMDLPWSLLLPTIEVYQGTTIILGHAGWTALIGLALGLAFLFREQRWAWIVLIVASLLVVLDHGSLNWIGSLGRDAPPLLIRWTRSLVLNGHLPVILLSLGIFAAVLFELRILRWAAAHDHFFPAVPLYVVVAGLRPPVSSGKVLWGLAIGEYTRSRRAAHFAAWRWRRAPIFPGASDELAHALFLMARAGGLQLAQPSNGSA